MVVVKTGGDQGEIDLDDLRAKIAEHADTLAAVMVTYPSTHGVFEEHIGEVCRLVHEAGGQVYVDGANLNAMVGLARPGVFGADVSHLNLHKTFCIPHGGGGPGVGPVAVREHLAPYLPNHPLQPAAGPATGPRRGRRGAVGVGVDPADQLGLPADDGPGRPRRGHRRGDPRRQLRGRPAGRSTTRCCTAASAGWSPTSASSTCGTITRETGVSVDDVAKRLIDYGFHAPTMSFPVAGTLMVEPTESEDLAELDRFVDAMIAIRGGDRPGRVAASGRRRTTRCATRRTPRRRWWGSGLARTRGSWRCTRRGVDPAGEVLAAGAPHRRRVR